MISGRPKILAALTVCAVMGTHAVTSYGQTAQQGSVGRDGAGESSGLGRISHYVPGQAGSAGESAGKVRDPLVVLEISDSQGIAEGDILDSQRASSAPGGAVAEGPEVVINTGKIKIIRVQSGSALGAVIEDGTEMSRQFFPRFPGVMAGDLVMREQARIEANLVLSPTVTLQYDSIFADPNPGARTFELSDSGRQVLGDMVRTLSQSRLSRIMVEGYTDTRGASELNQIESLQRALTVRQFMIVSLGFDPDRIVAVGLGESEPVAGPRVPDSARFNRRIIIKALPVSPSSG